MFTLSCLSFIFQAIPLPNEKRKPQTITTEKGKETFVAVTRMEAMVSGLRCEPSLVTRAAGCMDGLITVTYRPDRIMKPGLMILGSSSAKMTKIRSLQNLYLVLQH